MEQKNHQELKSPPQQTSWIRDLSQIWKENPRMAWFFKLAAGLYVAFQLIMTVIAICLFTIIARLIIHKSEKMEEQKLSAKEFFQEKEDDFDKRRKEMDEAFKSQQAAFRERYDSFKDHHNEAWDEKMGALEKFQEDFDKQWEKNQERKEEMRLADKERYEKEDKAWKKKMDNFHPSSKKIRDMASPQTTETDEDMS